MDITFNNTSQNGLIVFDRVPNILTVSSLGYTGTKARLTIGLSSASVSVGDSVTVNGETVTAVASQTSASPRQFGVGGSVASIANNLCSALMSIPSIVSSYSVRFTVSGTVVLEALGYGQGFAISYDSDIEDIGFTYVQPTQGSSAKSVTVTVSADNPTVSAMLVKTVASDEVSFDLSPVLRSIADWGVARPFTASAFVSDVEGEVTSLSPFYGKVVRGGHVEGQPDYVTGDFFAVPVNGAPDRDVLNGTVLYALQGSAVRVPWFTTVSGTLTATASVLDSGYSVVGSTSSIQVQAVEDTFVEFEVPSGFTNNAAAWYLSVTLPDGSVVRYNLIRGGLSDGCMRLYWMSSMGGVSFFDFTGERSESTEIDATLKYDEGSSYGYYTDEWRHDAAVSSVAAKRTFTVQSHVIEGAGTPVADDLARSPLAWVEKGGRRYTVIVTKVEKVRVSSNGTWRIKVSYYYSVDE